MDILNTSDVLAPANQFFYDRNLLVTGQHLLCHERYAQFRPIDTKEGDWIKFHRYQIPSAATAPLVEGQNPDPTSIVRDEVTSKLKEYGAYTTFSSLVDLVNEDKILVDLGRVMGRHGQLTMDTIARDSYLSGTSVYYSEAVASRSDIIDKVQAADFDSIERALLNSQAEYISEVLQAGTGYGTSSVSPSFFCVCHTDVKKDLPSLSGWIPAKDYPNQKDVQLGEVGAYGNFRFIVTSNGKKHPDTGGTATTNTLKYTTANTACDVYPILIFADNAVGKCPLKGNAFKNIVNQVGSAGAADALARFGTTGWLAIGTYPILNESWLYRLEVGVSR